jgi:hypothetical protein
MQRKSCTTCGKEKPVEQFGQQKRGLFGRRSKCRECVSEYNRKYSKLRWVTDPSFKERKTQLASEWAAKNPDRRAAIARKRNVKELASSPEKVSARALVNQRVRFSRMPKASSLNCYRCGVAAAHYHHHNGYAFEDRYNVLPVCAACHKALG